MLPHFRSGCHRAESSSLIFAGSGRLHPEPFHIFAHVPLSVLLWQHLTPGRRGRLSQAGDTKMDEASAASGAQMSPASTGPSSIQNSFSVTLFPFVHVPNSLSVTLCVSERPMSSSTLIGYPADVVRALVQRSCSFRRGCSLLSFDAWSLGQDVFCASSG